MPATIPNGCHRAIAADCHRLTLDTDTVIIPTLPIVRDNLLGSPTCSDRDAQPDDLLPNEGTDPEQSLASPALAQIAQGIDLKELILIKKR
ncbi:hypothetical protein [Trichothermofontia sp.]